MTAVYRNGTATSWHGSQRGMNLHRFNGLARTIEIGIGAYFNYSNTLFESLRSGIVLRRKECGRLDRGPSGVLARGLSGGG